MEPITERRLNDEDQNINCFHFRNFGCRKRIAGTECRGAGTGATRTGISAIGFTGVEVGALIRSKNATAIRVTNTRVTTANY
ncbi:MAG: hypothetical protein ACYS80_10920 [Planctomycetota bacterium]